MKVSVIGTGYVGLVSGVCLADKGHAVICVDVDQKKIDQINRGIAPIFEKDLDGLLKKNIRINLSATTDLRQSILDTDLSLIAVGTPFDGNKIDLTQVETVSREIGSALKEKTDYHMVVVKSTVVPGTTDEVVLPILQEASGKKAGIHFGVGMNPEFLREGEAVRDFMDPDRIVLGAIDEKSHRRLQDLYGPFDGVDIVNTNNKTAEMIKYTSNSLLATMISFSNEIANLCSAVGDVDVVDVMKAVHMDKRLSPFLPNGERIVPSFTSYIEAGCGFGGSCFPKDVNALITHGNQAGCRMQLLESVMQINQQQYQQILLLLRKHFPSLKGIRIAILGLAFKPGTDDIRESPAIPIMKELLNEGAKIKAFDPFAKQKTQELFGSHDVMYIDHIQEAIEDVDALVLVTRWKEFEMIPELLARSAHQPLVVDGRRMLDGRGLLKYEGIGLRRL